MQLQVKPGPRMRPTVSASPYKVGRSCWVLAVLYDALASQQSHFSSDGNRLQLCSAVQPCLHVQALAKAMQRAGLPPECWPCDVHTAGEDLPDASRKIPMIPEHRWACVVTYFDHLKNRAAFRRYKGMLFGLPLAVSAFNRLPMLLRYPGVFC